MIRLRMSSWVGLTIGIALLGTLAAGQTAWAQTDLDLGDIAFTGYISDAPDGWSFVLLVDVAVGTEIKFTDTGWLDGGSFGDIENILFWRATTNLPAGTEISIDASKPLASIGLASGDTFGLSNNGDQLFAYQDPRPSAFNQTTFVAAIQMNGNWESNPPPDGDNNRSARPSVFTDGVNSLAISPEVDNAVYDCSVTGPDTEAIRAAINDEDNWITSDSNSLTLPSGCDFSSVPVELMSFTIE